MLTDLSENVTYNCLESIENISDSDKDQSGELKDILIMLKYVIFLLLSLHIHIYIFFMLYLFFKITTQSPEHYIRNANTMMRWKRYMKNLLLYSL